MSTCFCIIQVIGASWIEIGVLVEYLDRLACMGYKVSSVAFMDQKILRI